MFLYIQTVTLSLCEIDNSAKNNTITERVHLKNICEKKSHFLRKSFVNLGNILKECSQLL